ncbi:MAG: ABC transporter permease [Gemmatimonadota bacterium]|jgi:putative ABC transport system permease protein|nr:ABC transporter permease [Gemmatimonadota bacterium]
MNFTAIREGVVIAIESLRGNKVRAVLTILGIVIGVATVMAMASLIVGIRGAVTAEFDTLGPNNFMVQRFDQTQVRLVNPGTRREPWEGMERISLDEAAMIGALPAVQSVTASAQANGELRYETSSLDVSIRGYSHLWPDYTRGEFVFGRNFLPSEDRKGAPVAVLTEGVAQSLFGNVDPTGAYVRVSGERLLVIGVYRVAANPFQGTPPLEIFTPVTTAIHRLRADQNWLSLLVVPATNASQAEAMDQVMSAMRSSRGLTPGQENTFALVRQEAFADFFDRITGVFFLVMLVLSSIGLLVGGVGVVAIMMISVTERTREIGVRKALGATPREIRWQFLVESVTVTLIGGIIGIALGGGMALLLGALTPIPASVPLWSIAAGLGVSAVTGIGFGLYPASRAARLDPVEALRYE